MLFTKKNYKERIIIADIENGKTFTEIVLKIFNPFIKGIIKEEYDPKNKMVEYRFKTTDEDWNRIKESIELSNTLNKTVIRAI